MKKWRILFLMLFTFPGTSAQEVKVIRDFRVNGELGVEKSFLMNWKVDLESCLKLEKNASHIDEIDLGLNVFYSPLKFISLGAGYRLTADQNKNSIYECKHRFSFEVEYLEKIKRLSFEYRLRYQNADDDYFMNNTLNPAKNILRNRLQIKYNIRKSKLSPYMYTELYGQLGTPDPFAITVRSAFGGRYSLDKFGVVKMYFRIDRELNDENPFTLYTVGIGYNFDF